jgi:hypothetical protein
LKFKRSLTRRNFEVQTEVEATYKRKGREREERNEREGNEREEKKVRRKRK